MGRRAALMIALSAALVACKGRPRPAPSPAPSLSATTLADRTAPPAPAAPAVTAVTAVATAASAASAVAASPPSPRAPAGDACRLVRGPIQLPLTGPATIWSPDDAPPGADPRIVFNRDGAAHPVTLPREVKRPADAGAPKPSERLALGEPAERATVPGCALAGASLFCADTQGAVHRRPLAGGEDKIVAHGRPGGSLAASRIAGNHTVFAFLADRRTTEGAVTQAFAGLDDEAPILLSEEGSGATFVTLFPRGDEVVAMYIDARRAMTPVHARVITAPDRLRLGADAVIFVGEGTNARAAGAVVRPGGGSALALLPTLKDAKNFGMALVRIDDPPRDDAPVTWSLYPAEIEAAPIAAAAGTSPTRVARVRTASNDPKSKRVLELGEVDASGGFKALCTVGESSSFTDVALLVDRAGALWVVYTDAEGTWIERRGA